MNAEFPFTLTGKHFILNTELKKSIETGFVFERSNKSRFFYREALPKIYSGIASRKTEQIWRNFSLLAKSLPYPLMMIFLDTEAITILDGEGVRSVPIDFFDYYRQIAADTDLDGEFDPRHLINIASGRILIPANDYEEAQLNAEVTSRLFSTVQEVFPESLKGLVVFSGELVWSGWLDSYQFISLLNNNDFETTYFSFDGKGIWQKTLLDLQLCPELKLLNRELLEPELLFIDRSNSRELFADNRIKLQKGRVVKALHLLDQNFMLFDINEKGFSLMDRDWFIPRFLIVKIKHGGKISKANYLKSKRFYQSCFGFKAEVKYPPVEQLGVKEADYTLDLLAAIKSSKRSGTDIDANDVICRLEKEVLEMVQIPEGARLCVMEGQYVSVGDPLATLKVGLKSKTISSKVAGKVQKRFMDNGILAIVTEQKDLSFCSGFGGRLKSVTRQGQIKISSEGYFFPLANYVSRDFTVNGVLKDWRKLKTQEVVNTLQQIIIYNRGNINEIKNWWGLKSGRIGGIIINEIGELKSEVLESLARLGIQLLPMEDASMNLNPVTEKLLHYNLGKYLEIVNGQIRIPAENCQGLGLLLRTDATIGGAGKGSRIKFFNYQSQNLYAKIEKCPRETEPNYLVNSPDGIFEVRPENFILLN